MNNMMKTFVGIPSDMKVYPWYENESAKKGMTLAQSLEERLIFGLNEKGWTATSAAFSNYPDQQEVRDSLSAADARKLLLIVLDDWFVSVNLNWVGDTNFDWGATVRIFDSDAAVLLEQTSGARHVIPGDAGESYPNLIRRAFRDRFKEILETTEVRNVLLPGHSHSTDPPAGGGG